MVQKSPSAHYRTTLSGCIFATKACIDNRKNVLISLPDVLVMWWTSAHSGWDLLAGFGHPCKFQRVSRLCSVTARHSSSGRQPNFAALNRGRHLYSAGRPSRWALVHIQVCFCVMSSNTSALNMALTTCVSGHDRSPDVTNRYAVNEFL